MRCGSFDLITILSHTNRMSQFKISDALHLDEADEAPDSPGIYVWYGKLAVGAADWDESLNASNELAQSQLLKALRDHSIKYRQQSLQLDACANFTTRWSGGLNAVLPDTWNSESNRIWAAQSESDVARLTSFNKGRKDLLSLLDTAFPIFSSPLYIGLAIDQTLRGRLRQHRTQFRRHWDKASKDPEYPSRIINPAKFADRAIKVGYSPADLHFFTLHVEEDHAAGSGSRNEDLLRSAEWLLNRWANPILGRQ
jgi:hypothetical protein